MNDKKNIWAVLDMPDEAKDKAKKLAKKAKKNIGKWLGELIEGLDENHPIVLKEAGNDNLSKSIKDDPFPNLKGIVDQALIFSIDRRLEDITTQLASIAVQIYDLKINNKFEKKSFWSRFL